MGQLIVPGTNVQYSNPAQMNQNTVVFPPGVSSLLDPADTAGSTWKPNLLINQGQNNAGVVTSALACPKPGSYDGTPTVANPVFNQVPASPGIKIPGTSVVFNNPSRKD